MKSHESYLKIIINLKLQAHITQAFVNMVVEVYHLI